MNKLVLAISGQIVRENSANLMNFWKGYINIQNAITDTDELKIVAHSWNPEFDELVKSIYNVDFIESEKQTSFVNEYMPLLNPIDKFEKGLNRSSSTWKNVSYQSILGNAKSRSKAISLIDNLKLSEEDRVIALRWDLGCTGSESVNKVIFDDSLNNDYLYSAYYSEIDEGYADMWFVAPYAYAKKFKDYERYVLESFGDENSYFDDFTKEGWFLAQTKNNKLARLSQYKKALFNKVLKITHFSFFKKALFMFPNKLKGFQRRLKNIIEYPLMSGENSFLLNAKGKVKFPNYQALNNHAILKSFVFANNLREKTRFLDIKDFDSISEGRMINPISFCYVIYSHSSFNDCWDMAINQALENLPENCKKIYLVSEDSSDTNLNFANFESRNNIELLTYSSEAKYTDRLVEVFNKIPQEFENIYFVHEDMPLISKVDKVYLNTLLHYLSNSNEFYIKLVDTGYVDDKTTHDSFPHLVKNVGGYSISVQPSLIKLKHMIGFLTNFHQDIYGFEQMCTRSNFTFSAVKGNVKVGKYLLCNQHFPHIATAISKGKWCTDEWGAEIKNLSNKYSIDLSLRGEC